MNGVSGAGPAPVAPSGTKPSNGAVFAQISALVLSVPAILFGLWMNCKCVTHFENSLKEEHREPQ
jgi:prolipoprotein diacylglyceryltransferase